jgi:peptidyl-prolyl cis-trans isomerase D
MLQQLRDNFRHLRWTLWLVIFAFFAGLFILGTPDSTNSGVSGSAQTIASIGESTVQLDEFRRYYRSLEENYRQNFGDRFTPDMARQLGLPQQVLQGLIGQKVLAEEAKTLGLTVSDEELRQSILELPGFKDESGKVLTRQRYEQLVRSTDYGTPKAFEDAMREELLVGKLRSAMAANVLVSDGQVEDYYRRQVERAKIRYIEVPSARFAAQATITDTEIAPYFEARKEEYRRPEQRGVTYLLIDQNKLRVSIEIPEADLSSYYQANQTEFTQDEQVRARHILVKTGESRNDAAALALIESAKKRVAGGEDFANVAKQVSEDAGTKDRGGDLGFFGRGQMVPEFEQAAFGGQPGGGLIGPIKTSFGYHLIETLGRREGGLRPFEEVKNLIRSRLQTERAQGDAEIQAQKLFERIKGESAKTDEQWKKLTEGMSFVSLEKPNAFGQKEPVQNLGRSPEFAKAVFDLEPGAISEPVKLPRGWAIVRLDEVKPPRIPELAEVTTQVRQAMVRKKQDDLALARLNLAKTQIAGGKSLDEIAKELEVEAKETEEFGHGQPLGALGALPAVSEAALSMRVGEVGAPVAARTGALLFQVTDRKSWDPSEFAKNKVATRENLEREEITRLLGSLIATRQRERVTVNTALLTQLGLQPPEPQG